MGMYTEMCINVKIKNDEHEIIKVLEKMLDVNSPVDDPNFAWPDHALFSADRASWMLQSSSFYHIPFPTVELRRDGNGVYLTGRCDLKNYGSEIERFFNWINPHIDGYEGDFIGYSRYEESQMPTLYFKKAES